MAYGFKPGKNKDAVYNKAETEEKIQEAAATLQGQIETLLTSKQDQHKATSVTLTTSNWSSSGSGWSQTATTSVKTTDDIICSPAPGSMTIAGDCGIYLSAQALNSLTFYAAEKPSSNVTMNIIILGAAAE